MLLNLTDLKAHWHRFANCSYLSRDIEDQKELLEQLKCLGEQGQKAGRPACLKQGQFFLDGTRRAAKSGAERLIFSSTPWLDIQQEHWFELKKWLGADENRQLIFLECQIDDLALALGNAYNLNGIDNRQIALHYCCGSHGQIALQLLAGEMAHFRCDLQIWAREDSWRGYFGSLLARAAQIRGIGEELLKVPNTAAFCLSNGPHQAEDTDLLQMKGALRDVPAILCGAGPSLRAELRALRACRHHSLIIGCGSAALALQKAKIAPHIISTICPLRASFERWQQLDTFTTPTFSCLRSFPGVDELMAGPRLHLTGLSSAPSTLWVEKALGFENETLHFGNSVVTATLRSCLLMGCNPIFLVGVDLSYGATGDKYVDGIQKIKSSLGGFGLFSPLIAAGLDRDVLTNWSWLTESRQISEIIAQYPQRSIRRCGQRGLEIAGIERGSLQNLARKGYPSRDLDNLFWAQLIKGRVAPKDWLSDYHLMRKSLVRCLDHFRQKRASLLSVPPWKRSEDRNFTFNYLESLEFERGQEIAFDIFFKPIQEALEPLEFDDMKSVQRAQYPKSAAVEDLLLQQGLNRLTLFVKKGDRFLQLIDLQISNEGEIFGNEN